MLNLLYLCYIIITPLYAEKIPFEKHPLVEGDR